jgi:hypothetical protein
MVLTVGAQGCASPLADLAARGEHQALRRELDAQLANQSLSNGAVTDVAIATAKRELTTAKGDAQKERVLEVLACTDKLSGPLGKIAETRGAGAPYALASLYEFGELSRGDAREFLGDTDGLFRQVGARTLTESGDRERRRQAFLDGHPMVRRAALKAAIEAGDHGDQEYLLERARLDPDPMVRVFAVRALGLMERATLPSGDTVALALADVFQAAAADDGLRAEIAAIWLLSPHFESGGRVEVRNLLARGRGRAAIDAALLAQKERPQDAELQGLAAAALVAHIANAETRDRLRAIYLAPLGVRSLKDAVTTATKDSDGDVAVQAWGRLLEAADQQSEARAALLRYAARQDGAGLRARVRLADAGDHRVQKWIEDDLARGDRTAKFAAVRSLMALGRRPRAAIVLTDPEVTVRTTASCLLLRK